MGFNVGQDPYFLLGLATGLAFSVPLGVRVPVSLRTIYDELVSDLGVPRPTSGDLTPWAERGVLLLNVRLTVKKGEANSHANIGWEELVGALLRAVAAQPRPVGFLGFGGDAKRMIHGAGPFVATHPCVCVPHPAARPPVTLRSSRPFSRFRDALREVGGELPDLRLS